jgi:hypothetical protein
MDIQGRTILQQTGIRSNANYKFRNEIGKGIYIAEIRQGQQLKVIKLQKQ